MINMGLIILLLLSVILVVFIECWDKANYEINEMIRTINTFDIDKELPIY